MHEFNFKGKDMLDVHPVVLLSVVIVVESGPLITDYTTYSGVKPYLNRTNYENQKLPNKAFYGIPIGIGNYSYRI